MHPNSVFPNPVYITKFLHTDKAHAEYFTDLQSSLLAANIALWQGDLTDLVRNGCQTFIIDPMTQAFTYDGYLGKQTYIDLPYAPEEPISATMLLADPDSLDEFTRSVLELQMNLGTGILIAPYFYARDLDDTRLAANLHFIAKAAEVRNEQGTDLPLFGWVSIGSSILLSPPQTTQIIEVYKDLPVEGYLVTAENFDDRVSNEQALMGLARLVLGLSHDRDIIVSSIAAYGEVLTALGANGFSAGIGWLETFREVSLRPVATGFAGDRVHRAHFYYIPELLTYVHPDDLNTIFDPDTGSTTLIENFSCDCEVCLDGLPDEPELKKRHFMIRRHSEMSRLADVAAADRPAYIRDRIQLALELSNIVEEEALVRFPTEHFVRWIAVLDGLSTTRGDEENELGPDELNEIVRQVRRDTSGQDRP
jgi:hypothetical protein